MGDRCSISLHIIPQSCNAQALEEALGGYADREEWHEDITADDVNYAGCDLENELKNIGCDFHLEWTNGDEYGPGASVFVDGEWATVSRNFDDETVIRLVCEDEDREEAERYAMLLDRFEDKRSQVINRDPSQLLA